MKGENLITLVGGAILGVLILGLAIITNHNEIYLFILAGTIFAMAVGGVTWNKFQEWNRTIINTRRKIKREEGVRTLRREFRSQADSNAKILAGAGFGEGIYGDSKE